MIEVRRSALAWNLGSAVYSTFVLMTYIVLIVSCRILRSGIYEIRYKPCIMRKVTAAEMRLFFFAYIRPEIFNY